MGKTELEIVKYVIGWIFRWFMSNEKNKAAKKKIAEKKESAKWS